ncbi:MAG: hypothetical protein JXR89_00845, partial [Deltaproteobacteria bacterium]|nr:hypothetical protein [Deltaproteobacteria bacterium]
MRDLSAKKLRLPFFILFTITGIIFLTTWVSAGTASAPAGPEKSFSTPKHTGTRALQSNTSKRLIVELRANSLAQQYALAPKTYGQPGARRLALQSTASRQYLQTIELEQQTLIKKLQTLTTGLKISRHRDSTGNFHENRYRMLFNGLSLELGDGDRKAISDRIQSLPEVKAVYQDRAYHPTLYAS